MDITHDGKTYHPNIKDSQIKSKKRALTYCSKEDPDPLQYNIDIKEETAAREQHKRILGKRLISGENLHDVVQEHPELIFGYKKLEADIAAYKRAKKEDKPDLPSELPNPWKLKLPVHTDRK